MARAVHMSRYLLTARRARHDLAAENLRREVRDKVLVQAASPVLRVGQSVRTGGLDRRGRLQPDALRAIRRFVERVLPRPYLYTLLSTRPRRKTTCPFRGEVAVGVVDAVASANLIIGLLASRHRRLMWPDRPPPR